MGKFRSLGLIVGLLFVATEARAQLTGLDHVWTVPGLMNTSGGLATVIACTNAGTSSNTIGVEVYGSTGTFVTDASISVAPSATVTFATIAITGMSIDANMATGTISKGHARIYGDSKTGVLCSAFLADGVSGLPTNTLTVAKKTKQKGD
jgi:hypothetical protein